MTTTARTADEQRALARDARRKRAARLTQLRRRVVATALTTFALAFGAVAYDGSMGEPTSAASSTTAARVAPDPSSSDETATSTESNDSTDSTESSSTDSSSADDVITTQQS